MMWCLHFLFFLGGYSVNGAKLPLPPYIEACHENDPNLDACALERAKLAIPHLLNGDKTYGIPSFNPLELEKIQIETGRNFTITLSKVKISGLGSMDVKKIRIDLPGKSAHFEFRANTVNILGRYQMDGKILFIPLKGKGDSNLTATNVDIKFDMNYDLIEKDRDTFMQLGKTDIDFDLENIHFQFDDLFDGNKELGENTNKLLNDEWRTLYTELRPAISKTISTIAVSIVTEVIEKIPTDVIFV